MADETLLNNQTENGTILNPAIRDDNATMLNSDATASASSGTILNTEALRDGTLSINQIVNGYKIIEKMDAESGEADLYICELDEKRYVLKLYRRSNAIKDEIVEQLKSIDSPYVTKIVEVGLYNEYPYEIMPYYKNGSLQGRLYSIDELREIIIPELNEALHELHSRGIVHKDLKPSNIMLCDNGKDISVIDFGISSMRENGNTLVLTKTGFTPDYTAHEAFLGAFLNESDYYSMGITLFELYTGTTPYKNLSPEEIEIYTTVQKLPLPDDLDQSFKNLILGLTYHDIQNRKDKSNPDRRWTYDEVCKWLNNEEQIIPGSGQGYQQPPQDENYMEAYSFKGEEYDDRHKLAIAFIRNWDEAKKELFNGMLSAKFKSVDQEFAVACMDAEEAYGTGVNTDLLFFRILYKLDDTLEDFVWRGHQYNNLEALGIEIQDKLWRNPKTETRLYDEILKYRIISEYLLTLSDVPEEVKTSVAAIEDSYIKYTHNAKQKLMNYYMLGFLLSGRKVFYKDDHEFTTVEELIVYMQELLQTSYSNFENYCESLIDEDGSLDIQLESWLITLGNSDQISKWKKKLLF